MTTATAPRHSRTARSRVARSPVSTMLLVAATVTAAVLLAVAVSGGTYAYLNSSATSTGGTITSGTATLGVTALTLPTTALQPGTAVAGTAVVTNSGTAKLVVRVAGITPPTSTAFSTALEVKVAAVSSTAACTTTTTPQWSGTFAAAPVGDLPLTLDKGTSGILCVIVSVPLTAPNSANGNTPATFTLLIDGRQPA